MLQLKHQEHRTKKGLEGASQKHRIIYKNKTHRITAKLSVETPSAQRAWNYVFFKL